MKISYSFGIIDLFHFGHLNALKEAHRGADLHVFGLVSDGAAQAWLGAIVSNFDERKAVLESISFVDFVMTQKTLDPTENLKALHKEYPDAVLTLCHGNDWEVVPAENFLDTIGGRVKTFNYYEKLSPVKILQVLNGRAERPKRYGNLISTKANTLMALKERLRLSKIEDISVYTVGQVRENFDDVFEQIARKYENAQIVARSSSKSEDCFENSNAGHYESVLNVHASVKEEVKEALETVAKSYERDGIVEIDEQILVQKQTENVVYSGVVFTRDIKQNRPYYVINYDDNGYTDSVTSGVGGKIIWVSHDIELDKVPVAWKKLIESVREIESLLKGMILDIEFAINKDGETIIFQVRPLAANYKFNRSEKTEKLLQHKKQMREEFLFHCKSGKKTVFSDMAFWNPAEIIGDNPRPLDFSLYREIITKKAWSLGLAPMGYRLVADDLMYRIGNKPYICVDYSFEALTPGILSPELCSKLVSFYKNKLSKDVTAHDKIEFEIVLSCFDFEIDIKLEELYGYGFSKEEIREIRMALHTLTLNGINNFDSVLKADKRALERLENITEEARRELQKDKSLTRYTKVIKTLLEALNEYGTPQFSRQARYAFIARVFCESMIHKNYISKIEYDAFMASIETVASDFERDFKLFLTKKIQKGEFDDKYGHLRAGTYDIRTIRYDQMEFSVNKAQEGVCKKKVGVELPKDRVIRALKDYEIDIDADIFIWFLKKAFEQREYFKFQFTKSLSFIIESIAEIGAQLGFSREEMSYLEIPQILSAELYSNEKELREFWDIMIDKRKEQYAINATIVLPAVITQCEDFDFIRIEEARPNFITEKSVKGETVMLEEDLKANITDKIVVIEKADPGFDWIFAKGIQGLITKYGGVASHMAIRCAEFEIPAAIGCGERIYSIVKGSEKVTLDCKNGKIIEEI